MFALRATTQGHRSPISLCAEEGKMGPRVIDTSTARSLSTWIEIAKILLWLIAGTGLIVALAALFGSKDHKDLLP
jgi:hypothetical protein